MDVMFFNCLYYLYIYSHFFALTLIFLDFHDSVFKLNDFNYARAIYINKKTNEQCTRTSFGMAMWKARSLEEHQLHLKRSEYIPAKPDKIDVWMMGDLIYYRK